MVKKFGLQSLEVGAESTFEYELYQIKGYQAPKENRPRKAKLVLAFAGQAHRAYFETLVKRTTKGGVRRRRQSTGADLDAFENERVHDRALFPRFIVKELIDVPMGDGKLAKSTEENIKVFIEELPEWIFDEVRIAAKEPNNFVEDDDEDPTEEEIEETAEK